MKTERSLPCSQEPATIPCSEPDESNVILHSTKTKLHMFKKIITTHIGTIQEVALVSLQSRTFARLPCLYY